MRFVLTVRNNRIRKEQRKDGGGYLLYEKAASERGHTRSIHDFKEPPAACFNQAKLTANASEPIGSIPKHPRDAHNPRNVDILPYTRPKKLTFVTLGTTACVSMDWEAKRCESLTGGLPVFNEMLDIFFNAGSGTPIITSLFTFAPPSSRLSTVYMSNASLKFSDSRHG